MSEKFNVLQAAMASSERIFTLLDTPVAIASPPAARRRRGGPARIVFDHVWFRYGAAAMDRRARTATSCATCPSSSSPGSASASSAPPAPARRR